MRIGTSHFFQHKDQKNNPLYLVAVIAVVTCLLILGMMVTGCTSDTEPPAIVSESEMATAAQNDGVVIATGALRNIASTNLAYDENTRIVYYKFKDSTGYNGYGFMSPYYGPHGNLCRYDNGQVVEMDGDSNVEAADE